MPATAAEVLQEFELESVTTRRVLERVPTDQLTWQHLHLRKALAREPVSNGRHRAG